MKIFNLFLAAALLLSGASASAAPKKAKGKKSAKTESVIVDDNRPAPADRLFVSPAVENLISEYQLMLTDPKLRLMFTNCFPNTLDTTVHYRLDSIDGKDDTFVYTGDIHAMWLRDSGAQVWPYLQLANDDPKLQAMLRGVINRQFKLINTDPFANAFNDGPTGEGWPTDNTDMIPEVHERKWEIDSHCYPIRLAYAYWKETGDASVFDADWLKAINATLATFADQQMLDGGIGSYRFQRKTERALDTRTNLGCGNPVKPCGLIASAFRPSDDATTYQYLIPSNFFAVTSLRKAAEILREVNRDEALAGRCEAMAQQVADALRTHAVYDHPKYGKIYAFEVDGFGNHLLMDDANVPSLLAMAYLGDVPLDDEIYQNTRRFVWSEDNPYFFRGTAGEGIGGPHIGYNMVWPMSIMMRAFTSTDDAEIAGCIRSLMATDAGLNFIHESFHKDDPSDFTRSWFAWQNSLFGELIVKLVKEGKLDMLNSLSDNAKVMSFNIRNSYGGDGPNDWKYRKEAVVNMILSQRPLVVGMQEVCPDQMEYLAKNLKGYGVVGTPRDDGKSEGEIMAIFYDKNRLTLDSNRTLWLSQTPSSPSRGWDAACNRTLEEAVFTINDSGKKLVYYNTHLDHIGPEARKNSMDLIVDQIKKNVPKDVPFILSADFNTTADDPIFDSLKDITGEARVKAPITDSHITYNGYGNHGKAADSEAVIDHLFYKNVTPTAFRTVADNYGVPFISDHYPITLTITL